ncbi:MAG: alkaline phosphatase family protein [Bacteroidales bacterium]|nr:alkaline phosphatase family protein [Bacteroidales bacterium]
MNKLIPWMVLIGLIFNCPFGSGQKTENVIVITLDGFRWREVFKGADYKLLKSTGRNLAKNKTAKQFWHEDAYVRRRLLMPFLWSTMASEGSLFGNRDHGCKANVANRYWFSYPGYHEILTGHPSKEINSNSLGPNPHVTVLEYINNLPGYRNRVAVFSSWNAFPDIMNEVRSQIFVNSSFKRVPEKLVSQVQLNIESMYDLVPRFIGDVRYDGFTFMQAFEYLKNERPRVLMIALDETDEFGHAGRYDLYLKSAHQTDKLIGELWNWIQNDSTYSNKTTLIITTDHGRGKGKGWKRHGRLTPHSGETWIAIMGPDIKSRGEILTECKYYNAQIAATIASLLKVSYKGFDPVYAGLLGPFRDNFGTLADGITWNAYHELK